jgi:ATP-dependent Clp protease ATP-binding subunit ClpA
MKTVLMKEIERFFRPEFINRLDETWFTASACT